MKSFHVKLNTFEDVRDFVEIADEYEFDVDIRKDRYIIDAKSYLGILSISLSTPLEVNVFSEGHDLESEEFMKRCGAWRV